MLSQLRAEMRSLANPEKAKILQRFFKTGKGEYAEGDKFLGIMVPVQRKLARKYKDMVLPDVRKLLSSRIHEHRLVALLILVHRYEKGSEKDKKSICLYYLAHTNHINNWDLVDLSAPKIVGDYLRDHDSKVLYTLANSHHIWERRIAIVSTYAFIKSGKYDDTLKISEILLNDDHDLIHKAVGWMLREVGKKDQTVEEKFLKKHYHVMPRTMLRYAIERFDEGKRKFYMRR